MDACDVLFSYRSRCLQCANEIRSRRNPRARGARRGRDRAESRLVASRAGVDIRTLGVCVGLYAHTNAVGRSVGRSVGRRVSHPRAASRPRVAARRRMRACARAVAATTVAVTAVTALEAAALTATYVTAPEARGPREGLARYDETTTTTTTTTRGGAKRATARRRLVAVVAGDSTACGVGCGDGAARARARRGTTEEGPTLARAFARTLGERMTADVEWRALGFKGADVRGLRDKLIPALREATEGAGGRGDDDDDASERDGRGRRASVDAVVIMCGLNDLKHSIVGRRSETFRTELRELVREVRDVVGDECVVVLPATPLEAATLFPPPLAWVATRMNDLWDEQKAHVSRLFAHNVLFVSKPSLDAMRERAAKHTGRVAESISLICGDGIHPNDDGYDAWARHIADECVPSLERALAAQK